jgi:hypothetical protein
MNGKDLSSRFPNLRGDRIGGELAFDNKKSEFFDPCV